MEEGGSIVVPARDAEAVIGEIADANAASGGGGAGFDNDVLVVGVDGIGVEEFAGSEVLKEFEAMCEGHEGFEGGGVFGNKVAWFGEMAKLY